MKATEKALERLIFQYQNSPLLKNYAVALLKDYDDFYAVLESLLLRLDLDAAEGVQLDLIGEIVGQKRPNSNDGAFSELPDSQYRILLRGIIFKNNSGTTIEDLFQFSEFVFGVKVFVQNYISFVVITFGKVLTEWELEVLNQNFPLAAGIRIGQIQFTLGDNPFSLDGDENGSGLSSLTETIGSGFVGILI